MEDGVVGVDDSRRSGGEERGEGGFVPVLVSGEDGGFVFGFDPNYEGFLVCRERKGEGEKEVEREIESGSHC